VKVFISWSGPRSRSTAQALRDWLPLVLQTVQPFMSAEDLDKGGRWASDLAKELDETGYGIVCVTRENLESAWLNFEAGALSKRFDTARVIPLLLDLPASDVVGPLATFQAASGTKEDLSRTVHQVNDACPTPLDHARLNESFEMWWPKLEAHLNAATAVPADAVSGTRNLPDMVAEVLVSVRSLERQLRAATLASPARLLPQPVRMTERELLQVMASGPGGASIGMVEMDPVEVKLHPTVELTQAQFEYMRALAELTGRRLVVAGHDAPAPGATPNAD
jgi:hypothetical protein